jgi:hypothetical protein
MDTNEVSPGPYTISTQRVDPIWGIMSYVVCGCHGVIGRFANKPDAELFKDAIEKVATIKREVKDDR